PVPTVNKADELILQDTLQVSLAEHKSRQEQEARKNVALGEEHLASVEIKKMVKGQEHVVDDSSIPRNDEHNIPGTRIEPRSDKESPKVEFTDVIIVVNVYDEEDKITDESFVTLADHLHEAMTDLLPTMVDKHIKEQVQQQVLGQQQDIAIWLALQIKFERLQVPKTTCRTPAVRLREHDDPHDDAHPEGKKSAKRQKTSEYETYVSRESSSGQDNEQEQGASTSGNQEQADDYDFWADSYTSDDDEIPTKQVSQDIMEEVSLNVDEAKLNKITDEMLRHRCTSGDEHQYHINQMKNFKKSDNVCCQRDPEAPTLSLINQHLLYLKKGNSGPEKIVLSLHKFPAVVFNDDDIKERTSRWLATKRSKKDFNISHESSSGDGVDTQSKLPDEQQQKTSEADINDDDSDDNDESDDERTEFDSDVILNLNKTNEEHNKEDENIDEEEDDEVTKELYKDVNVNLANKDTDMTYAD
nr:hypothetical protein [Tanacetum cinerariifolium]